MWFFLKHVAISRFPPVELVLHKTNQTATVAQEKFLVAPTETCMAIVKVLFSWVLAEM